MKRKSRRWLRRTLKSLAWIGGTLFVLVATVFAIGAYGRLRGPDARARAALALMQQHLPPPPGANAFPVLWLWRWPVPEAQLTTVTDADMVRLRQLVEGPTDNPAWSMFQRNTAVRMAGFDFITTAQKQWPAGPFPDAASLCPLRSDAGTLDCVAYVQTHAHDVDAALAQASTPLRRAAELAETSHMWTALPGSPLLATDALRGAGPLAQIALTQDAQRFLAGDTGAALAGACRSVLTWRRLYSHNNRALFGEIAAAATDANLQLMAAMLARLPAGTAIPPACLQATAPLEASQVDLCTSTHRRFRRHVLSNRMLFQGKSTPRDRLAAWLLFDPALDTAADAERDAPFCEPGFVAQALAHPDRLRAPVPRFGIARCLGSLWSCLFLASNGATEAQRQYFQWRALGVSNLAAHLRLAAALLALHQAQAVPGRTLAQRYAALPANLHSRHHSAGVDADGRGLYVQNLTATGYPPRRFDLVYGIGAQPARKSDTPASR